MQKRRIGVHTSIAGGIHLSLERARALGCSAVQIFSHNPRQWEVGVLLESSINEFRTLAKSYDISPVFIHTSYLINLASQDPVVLDKSVSLLVQELDIADLLGAPYLVLHTGSASQDTGDNARKRAIEALKRVSGGKEWKVRLLLENTAGERGDITSRIQDLSEIREKTASPLIGGFCIDTCHAFAAGYDLAEKNGISGLALEIKKYSGSDSVKLIHLNDSKKSLNSGVDRHEHIGEGGIGKAGLKNFLLHPAFRNVPVILETPKKSEDDDTRNLKVVRSFFKS